MIYDNEIVRTQIKTEAGISATFEAGRTKILTLPACLGLAISIPSDWSAADIIFVAHLGPRQQILQGPTGTIARISNIVADRLCRAPDDVIAICAVAKIQILSVAAAGVTPVSQDGKSIFIVPTY